MNTELATATANRINELHEKVLSSVNDATNAVNDAMMASVEIGGHIQQISRGERIAWLRDNCPQLDQKQIAAYLSIANTYKKRKNSAIDHRFFTLLGMTDENDNQQHTSRSQAMGQPWMAWSGKLTGYLDEMARTNPPEQWLECERMAIAEQLKPIVEIYQRIVE